VHRFDLRVFARSLTLAALAFALALLITAATDEGGVAWLFRFARALPAAPVCAAAGAWLALRPVHARGELRALEALGASPARVRVPAVLGAGGGAVVAAIVLLRVEAVDVGAFFPAPLTHELFVWRTPETSAPTVASTPAGSAASMPGGSEDERRAPPLEDGTYVAPASGLTVDREGKLTRTPPEALAGIPAPQGAGREGFDPRLARMTAGGTLACAGIALALVAAAPGRKRRMLDAVALFGVLATSITLFHAAGARTIATPVAALPSLALLAFAAFRYGAPPWSLRETKRTGRPTPGDTAAESRRRTPADKQTKRP
jgi:hypothetical protein